VTERPEDENESRTDDEAANAAQDQTASGDEATRAASSSEADSSGSAEEPAAQEEPAAEGGAEQPAEAEKREEPAAEVPGEAPEVVIEAEQSPVEDTELEEVEVGPRQKPEIPGADLEPVIIPEEDEFLDAEARAAAEAEAEAAAARAREESDEEHPRPIADAAIDLAAGARYVATGKRKTAVARVILKPGSGTYVVNDKPFETMFPRDPLRRMIRQPLESVGYDSRLDVVARMHGGGVSAQAGALRHGISRALIVADPNLRGELKRRGFLTRDPRVKERKKAGLKKARKRPQFSKR
jgi:small subunit ribosomal protein S9